MNLPLFAYLDLETTGSDSSSDRITEIAILRVNNGEILERWETLVNPGLLIPDHIEMLTGITNQMVAQKPQIEELIPNILRLLEGCTIVAHNARFDVGFLKKIFLKNQLVFDYPFLCTLQLSRALYPNHKRHNLGVLLERHHIPVNARHRALADAEALYKLMDVWVGENGLSKVIRFLGQQSKKTNLPINLSHREIEKLPNSTGVYIFYGQNLIPLYVGKSIDIKTRVLSHFSEARRNEKDLRISEEVRKIEYIETPGELSALLKEAYLVKKLSPIFNRKLRRHKSLFSWQWSFQKNIPPKLVDLAKNSEFLSNGENQFGIFRSRRAAENKLYAIAKKKQLCLKTIGLEKGKGPCFAYQLGRCKGVCVEKEKASKHKLRVAEGLLPLKLESWPFKGKIGIIEQDRNTGFKQVLIINQWRLIGVADNDEAIRNVPTDLGNLDLDAYKILRNYFKTKKLDIIELD